jgi:hypothetical protein
MKEIILTTINAKWIHPSLGLRLLKANLGELEDRCEIIELALRQPLAEKMELVGIGNGEWGVGNGELGTGKREDREFVEAFPKILGISVSIWNHLATIELLEELEKIWQAADQKPVVVLGGPEVSHLPPEAAIFRYANYVIRGEGERVFKTLCENILTDAQSSQSSQRLQAVLQQPTKFITAENVNVNEIKSAYHLYTVEEVAKKLIYVESSRGCPFNCEFCLSAVKKVTTSNPKTSFPLHAFVPLCESSFEPYSSLRAAMPPHDVSFEPIRYFPLEPFLAQMDTLVSRSVKTFKFLDRSFNANIKRALQITEFFLKKIEEEKNFVVHFEMVPSLFPDELRVMLSRFPPGTLRLEIGIQTLNPEVAARIGRRIAPEKDMENLRWLRENTNAIIHADLIAGLPGEDLASFGSGFDKLWLALTSYTANNREKHAEIQLGILKLLPGAPISRHNESFGMRYNPLPPYEILETSAICADDVIRIRNFARFWEVIINRRLTDITKWGNKPVFERFIKLSDSLFIHFKRNYKIDQNELLEAIKNMDI